MDAHEVNSRHTKCKFCFNIFCSLLSSRATGSLEGSATILVRDGTDCRKDPTDIWGFHGEMEGHGSKPEIHRRKACDKGRYRSPWEVLRESSEVNSTNCCAVFVMFHFNKILHYWSLIIVDLNPFSKDVYFEEYWTSEGIAHATTTMEKVVSHYPPLIFIFCS